MTARSAGPSTSTPAMDFRRKSHGCAIAAGVESLAFLA
jgi:hypothetical protein